MCHTPRGGVLCGIMILKGLHCVFTDFTRSRPPLTPPNPAPPLPVFSLWSPDAHTCLFVCWALCSSYWGRCNGYRAIVIGSWIIILEWNTTLNRGGRAGYAVASVTESVITLQCYASWLIKWIYENKPLGQKKMTAARKHYGVLQVKKSKSKKWLSVAGFPLHFFSAKKETDIFKI